MNQDHDTAMSIREKYFSGDRYRNVEGILRVVKDGLCHRCGACIGVCPVGTFGIDDHAYPRQADKCIECNICVRVCSGLSVDYPALGEAMFPGEYRFGSLMGVVRSASIAHAGDPAIRALGASGGVITQLLAHWLHTGRIKGALVTVEDPAEPARGKGIIARSVDEILASAQSRYSTAPSFSALYEIRNEPGPFAVVGLPCQIHALRRRQIMDPRWRERVPIVIGLLCHYNLPYESTKLAGEMLAPRGEKLAHVKFRQRDARGWPHNTLELTFTDGSKWRSPYGPAQIFNVVSRVSPLGRCLMCLDATAEFSDFSIGDPWIRNERGEWKYDEPGGWSSVLVRTALGEELLAEAETAGKLVRRAIPPEEVERGQHAMIEEKKERVAFRLRLRRRLGLPVPSYPMPLPATPRHMARKEMAFWFTRLIPISPRLSRFFLRLGLSRFGRYFVNRRIAQRRKAAAAGKYRLSASDFGDTKEPNP